MNSKLTSIGAGIAVVLCGVSCASAQYGVVPVQYVPVAPVQYQPQVPVYQPYPQYQPAPAYVVPQPVPVIARPIPRPYCGAPCQSCVQPRPVCRPQYRNRFCFGIFTPNFSFGFR